MHVWIISIPICLKMKIWRFKAWHSQRWILYANLTGPMDTQRVSKTPFLCMQERMSMKEISIWIKLSKAVPTHVECVPSSPWTAPTEQKQKDQICSPCIRMSWSPILRHQSSLFSELWILNLNSIPTPSSHVCLLGYTISFPVSKLHQWLFWFCVL